MEPHVRIVTNEKQNVPISKHPMNPRTLCFLLCKQNQLIKNMINCRFLGQHWQLPVVRPKVQSAWACIYISGIFWYIAKHSFTDLTVTGQFFLSVTSFLNKFAAKSCKSFPPHLNNVSTLRYL